MHRYVFNKCQYNLNLLDEATSHARSCLYSTFTSANAAYRMLHIVYLAWTICNDQHAAKKRTLKKPFMSHGLSTRGTSPSSLAR